MKRFKLKTPDYVKDPPDIFSGCPWGKSWNILLPLDNNWTRVLRLTGSKVENADDFHNACVGMERGMEYHQVYTRGVCSYLIGRFEEALHDAQKTWDLRNDFPEAYGLALFSMIGLARFQECQNFADVLVGRGLLEKKHKIFEILEMIKGYAESLKLAIHKRDVKLDVDICWSYLRLVPMDRQIMFRLAINLFHVQAYAKMEKVCSILLESNFRTTEVMQLKVKSIFMQNYKSRIAMDLLQKMNFNDVASQDLQKGMQIVWEASSRAPKCSRNRNFTVAKKLLKSMVPLVKARGIFPNRKLEAKVQFNLFLVDVKANIETVFKSTRILTVIDRLIKTYEYDGIMARLLFFKAEFYRRNGLFDQVEQYLQNSQRFIDQSHENEGHFGQQIHGAISAFEACDKTDYYATLKITGGTHTSEIRPMYMKLALQYHPDKNHDREADPAEFTRIKKAYDILSDQELRDAYDRNRQQFDATMTFLVSVMDCLPMLQLA